MPAWRRQAARLAAVLMAAGAAGLAIKFLSEHALPFFRWDASHYGRYWGMRGWIALHVVGGLVAILCGPLQLWSGLRGRTGAAHRIRGRIYMCGVLIGTVGGVWIAITSPAFPALGLPLIGLAAAWVATTGLAWAAIVRGQVALHKEMMIRSYVVTFAFVVFRLIADLPLLTWLPMPDRYVAIGWLCWTVPLGVTEIVVQVRRIAAGSRLTASGAA